jgi:hypothetical protein
MLAPAEHTYTNGYHVRVPVSDQTWKSLRAVWMINNATNIPIGQYVASNRLVMVGTLAPEALRVLNQRRARLIQKIQAADDSELARYEAVTP